MRNASGTSKLLAIEISAALGQRSYERCRTAKQSRPHIDKVPQSHALQLEILGCPFNGNGKMEGTERYGRHTVRLLPQELAAKVAHRTGAEDNVNVYLGR